VTGRPVLILAGLLGMALMLLGVAHGLTGGAAMIALGLLFSLAPGPLTAEVGQAIPARMRAVVFGWYSGASYAAMTVAPWLAGWLRDATGAPSAPLLLAAALSLAAVGAYVLAVSGRPMRRRVVSAA
jgi:MFS-type transporter involved in bile tolerance (Atg22 family)